MTGSVVAQVYMANCRRRGGSGTVCWEAAFKICHKTKTKGLKFLSALTIFTFLAVLYFPFMTGSGSPDWLMNWNNFIRDEPELEFSQET